MLELVERVRQLVRTDRDAAAAVLAEVDPLTAIRLVRAFSTYFHLANVAEQVHRARELQATRVERGTWLAQAVERIADAAVAPGELSRRHRAPRRAPGLHRAPHRGGAAHGADQAAPGRDACSTSASAPSGEARRSAASSAGWRSSSTCCGRATSCAWPSPTSSTRRATPSTTSTSCTATRCPTRSRRWSTSSPASASSCPVDARPLRFGSWIGGDRDGNPNVLPTTTLDVLELQHDHALRDALAVDRRAARRPLLLGADHRRHRRSSRPRWPPTSSACPSSTSATGA